jgi:cell division protein FtsN
MPQIETFEFRASLEDLKSIFAGEVVEALQRPLQAVGRRLAARSGKAPMTVYVCSAPEEEELRDYFAYALVRTVAAGTHDALLVDCNFTAVGLSGIVPQRDALGFLDLLLYGSSLGAIAQPTQGGAFVVGAGSFPVSKKSPFVMDAFVNAARYLSNQSKCVVFCGPLYDDADVVHAIAAHVDLCILVRAPRRVRVGVLDPIENALSGAGLANVWSVRVSSPAAAGAPSQPDMPAGREPAAKVEPETEPVLSGDLLEVLGPDEQEERPAKPEPQRPGLRDARAPRTEPIDAVPMDETTDGEPRSKGSSTLPRVLVSTLAVVVVGFLLWWLYLTKTIRERGGETGSPQRPEVAQQEDFPHAGASLLDSVRGPREATGRPDTTGAAAGPPVTAAGSDTAEAGATELAKRSAERAVPKAEAQHPDEENASPVPEGDAASQAQTHAKMPEKLEGEFADQIRLAETLDAYSGKYLVHISSFRTLARAEKDASYLAGRGYDVIISHVDLGAKGLWYRVYAGPVDTRDQAVQLKIRLDENPRVKFTRITQVP